MQIGNACKRKHGEKKEYLQSFARLGPATECLRIPFKESEHRSSAHMFHFVVFFTLKKGFKRKAKQENEV